jgi:hypothetical protein
MTIDEAIQTIQDEIGDLEYDLLIDFKAACQLGIEALKQLRDYRDFDPDLALHPLPGETEE